MTIILLWNNKLTAETAVKRLHQAINVEDFYGLAAYQGNTLCGMILGSKEQMFDGITFDVREFCVRNSLRGHGIGTELMIEFEKRLKCQGVSEIMLYTLKDDELVGFYKKCGLITYDYIVMMGKRL
jgi:GNAT superfamily N-acetyltransferase